jgi:hypothetical protein
MKAFDLSRARRAEQEELPSKDKEGILHGIVQRFKRASILTENTDNREPTAVIMSARIGSVM